MIHTIFGGPLTITADCGVHKPEGFRLPVHVVKAIHADDGADRFYLAHQIRADEGIAEIHEAIAAAPKVGLAERDLTAALNQ